MSGARETTATIRILYALLVHTDFSDRAMVDLAQTLPPTSWRVVSTPWLRQLHGTPDDAIHESIEIARASAKARGIGPGGRLNCDDARNSSR
jgi:hypothetical protein